MRNVNLELKIRNLKFQILFIVNFKDCKTLQFLYMTKTKPVEVNVNFLYPLESSENHRFFMFLEGIKENIDPKWVKQLQY